MKATNYIIIVLIALCIGSLSFYLLKKTRQLPASESVLHYQQAKHLPDFSLTDELGQPFTNEQLLNKWSLFFFGYISCPDVCPMTMQNLTFIYGDLKAITPNSQIILVSVDPNRDSIDNLKQYAGYFNPEFKALRAEHDNLFPFARSLGLMYAITDKENAGESGQESYWVDHSASIVLVNPRGKIEAMFKPVLNEGEIPFINSKLLLSDYKKVVALYR